MSLELIISPQKSIISISQTLGEFLTFFILPIFFSINFTIFISEDGFLSKIPRIPTFKKFGSLLLGYEGVQ